MRIETRRFVLRDFQETDRTAFRAYHRDPRYLAFYGPEERDPEHAENLLQMFADWAAAIPRRNYQLAIVSAKVPDALVGCCGLRTEAQPPGSAELGLELAAIHWGRYGYAIEIARALLGLAFEDLDLKEITGITSSANVPVKRLALWFGAQQIATRPGAAYMTAHGWTEQVWRITRETWEQRPEGGVRRAQ